jgi:predicted metal-dependent hydrolase
MTEIKISKIIRSRRRSIGLEVCPDATLVVRAPLHTAIEDINKLIEAKQRWIARHLNFFEHQKPLSKPREFVPGEEFWYLGDCYKLAIVEHAKKPLYFYKGFLLSSKYQGRARQVFTGWYRSQARRKIAERVELYAAMAGLSYGRITITSARRRWGSCSGRNCLSFSWYLIMAPLQVIDYVVAHEISHLKEKNHSKKFWARVAVLVPEYRQYRKWLRDNGHLLTF